MQTQLGNLDSNVSQVQHAVDAIPRSSSCGSAPLLNSCLSEIAAELIPLKCVCVTDFLKQGRVVIIDNVNKIREFEGALSYKIQYFCEPS
jgi:hypothetical protein